MKKKKFCIFLFHFFSFVSAQLRKKKSFLDLFPFPEFFLRRTGRREGKRSPSFPIRNPPPSNKKKINSLKMWTLERLAPGTHNRIPKREKKKKLDRKKTKRKREKEREKWIWRERQKERKKPFESQSGGAREREIQNCGNKNPRKKSERSSTAGREKKRNGPGPDMVAHDSAPAPFPFKTRSI